MKRFRGLTLGLVGLWLLAGTAVNGQDRRESNRTRDNEVCVYKDINYFGEEQCYRNAADVQDLGARSKSISSIRVFGRATITIFEKTSFGGRSRQITEDVPDLGKVMISGRDGWSDRVNSLRIAVLADYNDESYNSDRNQVRNQGQRPREGVCVYEHPNYAGRRECWSQGENVSSFDRRGGWNGLISSIQVLGSRTSVVVYLEQDYRGDSMRLNRNVADLAAIQRPSPGNRGRGRGNGKGDRSWDGQISSMRVESQEFDR